MRRVSGRSGIEALHGSSKTQGAHLGAAPATFKARANNQARANEEKAGSRATSLNVRPQVHECALTSVPAGQRNSVRVGLPAWISTVCFRVLPASVASTS